MALIRVVLRILVVVAIATGLCLLFGFVNTSDLKLIVSNWSLFISWGLRPGYLTVIFVSAIIGLASGVKHENELLSRAAAEAARNKAEEEARQRFADDRNRRLKEESEAWLRQVAEVRDEMARGLYLLPSLLQQAGASLRRAEVDFEDRAFAPFWDDVESATNELAEYSQEVAAMGRAAERYRQLLSAPKATAPSSSSRSIVPACDHRSTADLLKSLVRRAQRDFEFAVIYEQRKTNAILISGFGTLATAIYQVGDQISAEMDQLGRTVGAAIDDSAKGSQRAAEAADRQGDNLLEAIQELGTNAAAAESKRVHREAATAGEQRKQSQLLAKIERETRNRRR